MSPLLLRRCVQNSYERPAFPKNDLIGKRPFDKPVLPKACPQCFVLLPTVKKLPTVSILAEKERLSTNSDVGT